MYAGWSGSRISVQGCLYLTRFRDRFWYEPDPKAPPLTRCSPIRAPLLPPVPETSRCPEPAVTAREGSRGQSWQSSEIREIRESERAEREASHAGHHTEGCEGRGLCCTSLCCYLKSWCTHMGSTVRFCSPHLKDAVESGDIWGRALRSSRGRSGCLVGTDCKAWGPPRGERLKARTRRAVRKVNTELLFTTSCSQGALDRNSRRWV